MTGEGREPLTPSEADLRDFAFTPMYRARLFGSAFHARVTDSEWRAGVTLWLKSQDQVPAGSLPDDDVELCRLAELARDFKTWKKLKAGALRGWERYSDGRLYHPVVAQITLEQWIGKLDQRKRTIKARIANLETKLDKATAEIAKRDLRASITEMRQEEERIISSLSQAAELLATVSVTEGVVGAVRQAKIPKSDQSRVNTRGAALHNPDDAAHQSSDANWSQIIGDDRLHGNSSDNSTNQTLVTEDVTEGVTDSVTRSKRERQGQGQGERDLKKDDPAGGELPLPAPSAPPSKVYAFQGAVIRLTQPDFDKWQAAYSALPDLAAELTALDDWIRGEPDADQKRWFHVVSGALKKRHVAAANAKKNGSSGGFTPFQVGGL